MESSPLNRLSAELRNHIWELVIGPKWNRYSGNKPLILNHKSARQPGITRACRQTREETLSMFYARNVFVLGIDVVNLDGELHVRGATFGRFISWMQLFDDRLDTVCPSVTIELSSDEDWEDFDHLNSEGGNWRYLAQLAETRDHNGLPCIDIEVHAEPRTSMIFDEDLSPDEIAKAHELAWILQLMGFFVCVTEDSGTRLT